MSHTLVRGECVVCGGQERDGTLTTDCCGRRIVDMEAREIQRGRFDFKSGRGWFEELLDGFDEPELR